MTDFHFDPLRKGGKRHHSKQWVWNEHDVLDIRFDLVGMRSPVKYDIFNPSIGEEFKSIINKQRIRDRQEALEIKSLHPVSRLQSSHEPYPGPIQGSRAYFLMKEPIHLPSAFQAKKVQIAPQTHR